MRIYIASSWKNKDRVRLLAHVLRAMGHSVYDFTDPACRTEPELPPEKFPELFDPKVHNYEAYLKGVPEWRPSVLSNKRELDHCDFVVLLLPCGNDSHADWAYGVGRGKRSCVVGHPNAGDRTPTHLWTDEFYCNEWELVGKLASTAKALPALPKKESPHFQGRVSVKAIVRNADGKVLVLKDARLGRWELPGGRLNRGETVWAAFQRELREELGLDFLAGELFYSEQYNQESDGTPHLMLVYSTTMDDEVVLSDESSEKRWIRIDDATELDLYPNCRNALMAWWQSQPTEYPADCEGCRAEKFGLEDVFLVCPKCNHIISAYGKCHGCPK